MPKEQTSTYERHCTPPPEPITQHTVVDEEFLAGCLIEKHKVAILNLGIPEDGLSFMDKYPPKLPVERKYYNILRTCERFPTDRRVSLFRITRRIAKRITWMNFNGYPVPPAAAGEEPDVYYQRLNEFPSSGPDAT
jgi:hypothetical protein